MRINVLTIFPGYLEGPLGLSIPGRAAESGLVEYRVIDLRDHTHDRHRTTDDEPYGGKAGMVMKPEPFYEALEALPTPGHVVSLTPRGRPFDHEAAVRLALVPDLTLLCGRYKGIDQRVTDEWVDEEVSIGDYVPERRRARCAGRDRRRGAAAPRRPRRPRVGVLGLLLRSSAVGSGVYQACRVSGQGRAVRPAIGRPCRHRALAGPGRRTSQHAVSARTFSIATPRTESPEGSLAGDDPSQYT